MLKQFVKTYGKKGSKFKHTAMVTHNGTVVAFAMDDERQIHYTVLDPTKGEFDVDGWSPGAQKLTFPNEIAKVGYAEIGNYIVPEVKADVGTEEPHGSLPEKDKDAFLSTTARLSADANFQVISDNKHIYLFRQSVDSGHPDSLVITHKESTTGRGKRSALHFNGNDTHIALPGRARYPFHRGFTFEAHVLFEAFQPNSCIFYFGRKEELPNQHAIVLRNQGDSGTIVFELFDADGGSLASLASTQPVVTDKWTHIAVSMDEDKKIRMYFDGKPVGELIAEGLPASDWRDACFIGKGADEGLFKGKMRDFKLWVSTLTQDEIKRDIDRRLTGQEKYLAMYFPLDDGWGRRTSDLAFGAELDVQGDEIIWDPTLGKTPQEAEENSKKRVSPLTDSTLLVDRFILSKATLKPVLEVRYRRSRHKTKPESNKDTLGTTDMNKKKFYEPTFELDFVGALSHGAFSVLLLPTAVQDLQRWQIFAKNQRSGRIDSFNIERGGDGLFNPMGTTLYTSPEEKYQKSVLERKPGMCPFAEAPLVPLIKPAKTGLTSILFSNGGEYAQIPPAKRLKLDGSSSWTIEFWAKVQNGYTQHKAPVEFLYERSGLELVMSPSDLMFQNSRSSKSNPLADGAWHHIAFQWDKENTTKLIFVDGEKVASFGRGGGLNTAGNGQPLSIGSQRDGDEESLNFQMDELRIWHAAIPAEIIKQRKDFRLIGNEAGLTAYYRFDEGTGSLLYDLSSNNFHGRIKGTPKWMEDAAPVGDHTGIQHSAFGFASRRIGHGLSAVLYYQQENRINKGDLVAKPMRQNARVLLSANTIGHDPFILPMPKTDGLQLELTGESFSGNVWKDLSGKEQHGTCADGTPASPYSVADHNGKSFQVVRLSNSDDFTRREPITLPQSINLGEIGYKHYTVMIVDRAVSGNPGNSLYSTSNANWWFGTTGMRRTHCDGINTYESSTTNSSSKFMISSVVQSDTDMHVYFNGKEKILEEVSSEKDQPGSLSIGQAASFKDELNLDIACVLIWNRALTDAERVRVENWLDKKYGLGIDHKEGIPHSEKNYLATVDIALTKEGKLAEFPEVVHLPLLKAQRINGGTHEEAWNYVHNLEQEIGELKESIGSYTEDIDWLKTEMQRLDEALGKLAAANDQMERIKKELIQLQKGPVIHYASRWRTMIGVFIWKQIVRHSWGPKQDRIRLGARSGYAWRKPRHVGGKPFYWLTEATDINLEWSVDEIKWEPLKYAYSGGAKDVPSRRADSFMYVRAVPNDRKQRLIDDKKKELGQLEARYNYPNGWIIQKAAAELEIANTKEQLQQALKELQINEAELNKLRGLLDGEPARLESRLMHIDHQGLTVSGGLLGAAWSKDTPHLFSNSEGKVSLYFRGAGNQFFAAYLSSICERNHYTLEASEEQASIGPNPKLHLLARSAESVFDQNEVSVKIAGKLCTLTIYNPEINITETWEKLPLSINKIANIINGKKGSTYDYSNATHSKGYDLADGSHFFTAYATREGQILAVDKQGANQEETANIHWAADAPGKALEKAALNGCASSDSNQDLAREDDLTIEAWIKPGEFVDALTGTTSKENKETVLIQNLEHSVDYAVQIEEDEADGPIAFLTKVDRITVNHDFPDELTIECWLNPTSTTGKIWEKQGEEALALDNGELKLTYGEHHLLIDKELESGKWMHVAVVRRKVVNAKKARIKDHFQHDHAVATYTSMEYDVYINGKFVGEHHVSGGELPKSDAPLVFQPDDAIQFHLADIRVWRTGRTQPQITHNYQHYLKGDEPYFLVNIRRDGSGNPKNVLNNKVELTTENSSTATSGKNSPPCLKHFHLITQVGNSALKTKEPLYKDQWMHFAAIYNQSFGLQFKGEDFMDCDKSAALNVTEELTLEAFVKLDVLDTNHGLISKGRPGTDPDHTIPYNFYINKDNKLVFGYRPDGVDYLEFVAEKKLDTDFHRLAVTRKRVTEKKESEDVQMIELPEGKLKRIKTKKVDAKEYTEIRLYRDGVETDLFVFGREYPLGNSDKTLVGQCYLSGNRAIHLQGQLGEVRIWDKALEEKSIGQRHLKGREPGLVAWWSLEENENHFASDSKGSNDAVLSGTTWIKSPDPEASTFKLMVNGDVVDTENIKAQAVESSSKNTFKLGDFGGVLEEVRIWSTARSFEQIRDNLFTRLRGEKKDLIANYTMDGDFTFRGEDGTKTAVVHDLGLRGNHLTVKEGDMNQILSTAPIANDTAQVRSALSGVRTTFNEPIHGSPSVVEYGDMQTDEEGAMFGVLKRCYCYIQDDSWKLITGFKVGNLVQEWIGQAQYDPQVMGFIEGAPPVPGENLTEGPEESDSTYDNVTSVSVKESETVSYSLSTSSEKGFTTAFGLAAKLGMEQDVVLMKQLAPLGFGVGLPKRVAKVTIAGEISGKMESTHSWSDGESLTNSRNQSQEMTVGLNGNWEEGSAIEDAGEGFDEDKIYLTKRYKPSNMGFALVQSETADVFALRLEHNNALVMIRMLPNPDIPKDWNIIPFPINPRYTKQGTLDGRVGFKPDGAVNLDSDYKEAQGYGEYSYFKPKEAYALKRKIKREEEALIEFYKNYDVEPIGLKGAAVGAAVGTGGGAAAMAGLPAVAMLGAAGATVGGLIGALTSDKKLPERFAKRNLINTYVWTADGGFFAETTEIGEVRQESHAGTSSFNGEVAMSMGLDIELVGLSVGMEMNASLGGNLNYTKTKESEAENSFSIEVSVDTPGDLQKYVYDDEGELKRKYDAKGNPINLPGKVDAYRFMTFYLEPDKDNFEDLFNKVIDPIWLETHQGPNADALRGANQAEKKPRCWRVMHRVTFVSRILPEFESSTNPKTLDEGIRAIDIASNYQLITKLDPLVRGSKNDFGKLSIVLEQALNTHMKPLIGHKEEILEMMAHYYGLDV